MRRETRRRSLTNDGLQQRPTLDLTSWGFERFVSKVSTRFPESPIRSRSNTVFWKDARLNSLSIVHSSLAHSVSRPLCGQNS